MTRTGVGLKRLLVIDSALGVCAAGLVEDAVLVASRTERMHRGQAARLPALVAELLAAEPGRVGQVAATVGPGSFTGLRAGLALAHGLAAGFGCPVTGVAVHEAYALGRPPPCWVCLPSRAGRLFLFHDGLLESVALAEAPDCPDGTLLLGPAAGEVAGLLQARGGRCTCDMADAPPLAAVAALALANPGRAAVPLYVDAPEAKPPMPLAGGPLAGGPLAGGPLAAGPAHAAAMAAVHAQSFPPAEAWDATSLARLLATPGTMGLVDPGGAFILWRVAADEADLLTLAVPPALRRRGVARRLLRAAMQAAAAAGVRMLFLEVAEANAAARAFYAQAGFEPAGRRPRYYASGEDALVLRRELGAGKARALPWTRWGQGSPDP